MDLSSTALTQGSDMPRQYTCEGDDVAPPLCWSDVPDRTRSLALIVDDPDAPDPAAPTMTWVHTGCWSTSRPPWPRFPKAASRCPTAAATA